MSTARPAAFQKLSRQREFFRIQMALPLAFADGTAVPPPKVDEEVFAALAYADRAARRVTARKARKPKSTLLSAT